MSALAAAFLDALAKLESFATLYGAEHHRVAEGVAAVLAAGEACTSPGDPLVFGVIEERARIGDHEVAPANGPQQQVLEELMALGVAAICVRPHATVDDWHALARCLRSASAASRTGTALQGPGLEALPASIEVARREFGRRVAPPGLAAAQAVADETCAVLEKAPFAQAERRQCRNYVEGSLRRMSERLTALFDEGASDAGSTRDLLEVLNVAGSTLRHAIEKYIADNTEGASLRSLFQSIEAAAALSEDPDAARVMLDVLRESADEVLGGGADATELEPESTAGETYSMRLGELRCALAEFTAAAPALEGLDGQDRGEAIAICLQLLLDAASPGVELSARHQLSTLIKPPLSLSERRPLEEALAEACSTLEGERLDRLLGMLLEALSAANKGSWPVSVLQVFFSCPEGQLEALWPYAANEILAGRSFKDPGLAKSLCGFVSSLPTQSAQAAIRRLGRLDAVNAGALSRAAFSPPREDLSRFYQLLLDSRLASQVGPALLAGLKAHTPAWPGGLVFQTCENYDDTVRFLLLSTLKGGSIRKPSQQAQQCALERLSRRLVELPPEQRETPWVAAAIRSLGFASGAEVESHVQQIASERRWLLKPVWPRPCRAAAKTALASIRARSLGA